MFDKIKRGRYDTKSPVWDNVSILGKEFMR